MAKGGKIFRGVLFFGVFAFLSISLRGFDVVSASEFRVFKRDLRIGSSGEDVRNLQELLNSDPSTVLAVSGPGSSGNETAYFGVLTKMAVIKFQEVHAGEILAPLMLYRGTGYVGLGTRNKMEVVHREFLAKKPGVVGESVLSTGGSVSAASPSAGVATHPNLRNIDKFLDAINIVATKRGFGPDQIIDLQKKAVESAVSTTTDYALEFEKQIAGLSEFSLGIDKVLAKSQTNEQRGFFAKIPSFLKTLSPISINLAYAQSNGDPFGGMILFYFYCTCSGKWLMTLKPTAPNYVVLLTHQMGMQRYLNYNVPFARYLLGFYESGDGDCRFQAGYTCITLPSEGKTTMTLGSSS